MILEFAHHPDDLCAARRVSMERLDIAVLWSSSPFNSGPCLEENLSGARLVGTGGR